jgi:predicted cation transporter
MNGDFWLISGLTTIIVLVLALPFIIKKVEKELEAFLFVMGILAVSISRLWDWRLVEEALTEPVKITIAVFVAGLLFRLLRPKLGKWTAVISQRLGYRVLFFITVVGLGLLSSVITAIIAALVLSEIISALQLPRKLEVKIVIIACFSIGLGAALTPIGEPLATIAISKLKGEPYHAGFFFLLTLLGTLIIPMILALGILPAFLKNEGEGKENTLTEDRPEQIRDVGIRAFKVYLFVMALVFLGTGLMPLIDKYLVRVPAAGLYWVNIISAILDNATLTAAEITPLMPEQTIKFALMGLLIAGGMLIPGNIPNIICAGKLSIKSREWAIFGVPLGLVVMTGIFIILILLGK